MAGIPEPTGLRVGGPQSGGERLLQVPAKPVLRVPEGVPPLARSRDGVELGPGPVPLFRLARCGIVVPGHGTAAHGHHREVGGHDQVVLPRSVLLHQAQDRFSESDAVLRLGVAQGPETLPGPPGPGIQVVPEADTDPLGTLLLHHAAIDVDLRTLFPRLVHHDQRFARLVRRVHAEGDSVAGFDEAMVDEQLLLVIHHQRLSRQGLGERCGQNKQDVENGDGVGHDTALATGQLQP